MEKKSSTKYWNLIVFVVLGIIAYFTVQQIKSDIEHPEEFVSRTFRYNKYIDQFVITLNQNLPEVVDEDHGIQWNSVEALPDRHIQLNYTLLDHERADLENEQVRSMIKRMFDKMDKLEEYFGAYEMSFIISLKDRDGTHIITATRDYSDPTDLDTWLETIEIED